MDQRRKVFEVHRGRVPEVENCLEVTRRFLNVPRRVDVLQQGQLQSICGEVAGNSKSTNYVNSACEAAGHVGGTERACARGGGRRDRPGGGGRCRLQASANLRADAGRFRVEVRVIVVIQQIRGCGRYGEVGECRRDQCLWRKRDLERILRIVPWPRFGELRRTGSIAAKAERGARKETGLAVRGVHGNDTTWPCRGEPVNCSRLKLASATAEVFPV